MRVCHVCNAHPVDDKRVFHQMCVGLVEAGYEVDLFAVGKETEIYREHGVTIHPLPECRNRRERFARRSRVAQIAANLKPDLFHVHEPELLGSVLASAHSQPVVYDVHESYLDVLMERDWIPQWLKPFVRLSWDKWECRLVRRCAAVVVVTEGIAHRYRQIHSKVQVVANYPNLSRFRNLPPMTRDGVTCVYAGLINRYRGLSQVFKALAILKKRGLAVPLALAGRASSDDYLRSLWEEADCLGIRELVNYHGLLSIAETIPFQQQASIGLVPHLPIAANNVAALPGKLLECMALGIPVVFSDFPTHREVAGVCGAGIAVDPTNPEQIANAIECLIRNPNLARQMGEAGRRAIYERFNWGIECVKLLKLYRDILGVSDSNGLTANGITNY